MQYQRVAAADRKKNDDTKRCSIMNFVSTQSNKPVSDRVCEDLKGAIAQWIASSGRPTAIVEDPGLQTVLCVALQNQQYTLPSRRTIDNIIARMYDEKLNEYRKTVDSCTSLALTTDFWTSNNNESYCGITGHWIDGDWKLMSVTLGCLHVDERHTAANVASLYEQFADEWHITDKVHCIVSDNARNMVAAIGRTPYSHLPCVAHSIQLSILHGLKIADASNLLAKCRHIVGHFKHSAANTTELKACHSRVQEGSCTPFHKLQQDVATRWNSTYLMMTRLLEVKDAIKQYHTDHPKNYTGNKLLDIDWDKMAKYVDVLGVLADATQFVGGEDYVSCSTVLPLLAFLKKKLQVHDDDPGYIARLKTAFLSDFSTRIAGMDALPVLQMAVALDPRYKKLTCLPREQRDAVWDVVSTRLEDFCIGDQQEGPPGDQHTDSIDDSESEPVAKKPKLTLLLNDSESDADDEEADVPHTWTVELAHYREEDALPETENPLTWWKLNSHRFSFLASFAKTVLCVPATSVPCERLFSSSGYIVNKTRAALLPENVTSLVCLRDWLKLKA